MPRMPVISWPKPDLPTSRAAGPGVALLALLVLVPAAAAQSVASPPRLDQLRDAWTTAYEAGNAAAMSDLYVEQAVRMPYDAPAAEGREAILATYRAQFEARRLTPHIEFTVQDVDLVDRTAIERGRYEEALRSAEGTVRYREVGKYVSVARRGDDGRWRYAISIFNRDAPRG